MLQRQAIKPWLTSPQSSFQKKVKPPYPSTVTMLDEVKNMEVEKERIYRSFYQLKTDWKQIQIVRKTLNSLFVLG